LDRGDGQAGIAVQIDRVTTAVHAGGGRTIVDDEAQAVGGAGPGVAIAIGGQA
jgi:hypothetical protein